MRDPNASKRLTAIVAFATVYVVWGSTYLGIKIALNDGFTPALLGGTRLVIAGVLLLALALIRGTSLRISRRDLSTSAIVGLCLLVGGMYSTMLAEQSVDSSLAALVVAAAPLWMAAAESVVPGMERPTRRAVVGLAVGLAGLALLVGPRIGGVSGTPAELGGIVIQMVGSWLWVAGSIVSKKRPLTTDGTVATGYEMLIAGAVLTLLALLTGEIPRATIHLPGVLAMLYLATFGSAIAFTAFMWLIRNVAASKVMTYAYVNPVVAVLLGYVAGLIGLIPRPEVLDAWGWTGMVVITLGVALATSAPSRGQRHEALAPEPGEVPEAPAS